MQSEENKSGEIQDRSRKNEFKKNLSFTMKNNVLFKSKKILYENFKHKFDDIMNKLNIECNDEANIEYDQYLQTIKALIFLDQNEEAKISENKEVFEGWETMMGNVNGYITRLALQTFLWSVLNLKSKRVPETTNIEIINKNSNLSNYHKDSENSSIQVSNIDLLKVDEQEIRLDSLNQTWDPLAKIQQIYSEIKGEPLNWQILPIKKNIKNFFNLKLKESQQKSVKHTNLKEETTLSLSKSKYPIFNNFRWRFKP